MQEANNFLLNTIKHGIPGEELEEAQEFIMQIGKMKMSTKVDVNNVRKLEPTCLTTPISQIVQHRRNLQSVETL